MIADAAARHTGEGLLDDLALPGEPTAAVMPARQEELERCGMRKLRGCAEAAVAHVEQARHLIGTGAENVGADRARLRLVQALDNVLANRARVGGDTLLILAERARDLLQHTVKAGPAVRIVV